MSKKLGFKSCASCDEPVQLQTIQVPTCGSPSPDQLCESQKGKFYDKLIEDFIVPKVGSEGKIFVCDATLWSKHQWVAVVTASEKISAFQILKVGSQSLTILNGCRTGEPILGNIDPGTLIKEGGIIYPIPPQGCSQGLCEQVSDIIKTCGADAVRQMLKESEEICFTNLDELSETERGHFFAGTMPDPCNCPDDYGYGGGQGSVSQNPESPWRSCLRKLIKIFTSVGGRTICFSNIPSYNRDSDEDRLARELVLDQNGCIAKGDSVYSCEQESGLAEGEGADAIVACVNGVKSVILPECGKMLRACCDEDDENPKWYLRDGLIFHKLENPITIYDSGLGNFGSNPPSAPSLPATIDETVTFNENLIPESCGTIYANVDVQFRYQNTSESTIGAVDIRINGEYYRRWATGAGRIATGDSQELVPLDDSTPNELHFEAIKVPSFSANHRARVRITGFWT